MLAKLPLLRTNKVLSFGEFVRVELYEIFGIVFIMKLIPSKLLTF